MEPETEYRFFEWRADADTRTLEGVAIRYGDVADLGAFKERFEPGAFGPDVGRGDTVLNIMHDRRQPLARSGGGGLVLTDSNAALTVRAVLPSTRAADDALELVKVGVLRGFSLEFRPTQIRVEGGVRIVTRALLGIGGVALVDKPAFPASLVRIAQRMTQESRPTSPAPWWLMS